MKKINNKIWVALLLSLSMTGLQSCDKHDTIETSLTSDNHPREVKMPLDQWLEDNFELPYNTQVVYKQQPFADVVAPRNSFVNADKVQAVMEVYRDLWLAEMEKVFGKEFMRQYAPRQVRLYGMPNYNMNGAEDIDTKHVGTAIMPLYGLDDFDPSSEEEVYRLLREISYCFAKNLLELRPVDLHEFAGYNFTSYDSNWLKNDLKGKYTDRSENMQSFGFFTKAAQADARTDFAETMSLLFCQMPKTVKELYTLGEYEDPSAAKTTLQHKVAFVDQYLQENFGVKRELTISRILPRAIVKYAADHQKKAAPQDEPQN